MTVDLPTPDQVREANRLWYTRIGSKGFPIPQTYIEAAELIESLEALEPLKRPR